MTDDRDSQRTETMAQRDARLMRIQNDVPDYAIKKAVGAALRHAREAEEWSRTEFVALLPSGIGERTLLSYEHGSRSLTVVRLIELCRSLEVGAPSLLIQALQQAHIHVDTLTLRIDLRALLNDTSTTFNLMFQGARNKLNECPEGTAETLVGRRRRMVAYSAVQNRRHQLGDHLRPTHLRARASAGSRSERGRCHHSPPR